MRRILSYLMLGLVIILLIQQLWNLRDPLRFPPDDFVEYYAAGKLNRLGQNPYSAELLLPIENEAGRDTSVATIMWNPPWTLTLVMPLSHIHPYDAKIIWLLTGLVIICYCADQLWFLYGGSRRYRWVSFICLFTFYPIWPLFPAGQIGAWLLLGVTLFIKWENKGYHFLAGAITVLMAIKPHLFYLFWLVILIWGCRKSRALLLGGITAGLISSLIPVLFNSEVWSQYLDEFRNRPPSHWKTPTLGTAIRLIEMELLGKDVSRTFSSQFIPLILGLIWLTIYYRKYAISFFRLFDHQARGDLVYSNSSTPIMSSEHSSEIVSEHSPLQFNWLSEFPKIILISFITTAYGAWPFDMIVLLPAVIQLFCLGLSSRNDSTREDHSNSRFRGFIKLWILLNGLAFLLNFFGSDAFLFIWYPFGLTILYFFGLRRFSLKREQ